MKSVIEIIAKENGVSENAVREEISEAIALAKKSEDPSAREFWSRAVPEDGDPAPDELVAMLADITALIISSI